MLSFSWKNTFYPVFDFVLGLVECGGSGDLRAALSSAQNVSLLLRFSLLGPILGKRSRRFKVDISTFPRNSVKPIFIAYLIAPKNSMPLFPFALQTSNAPQPCSHCPKTKIHIKQKAFF